jgi:hypothetical protein
MEPLLRTKINDWKEQRGLAPYSPKTINKYMADIRKLAPEKEYTDLDWTTNTEEVSKKLAKFKPTTQRNYYNSLLIGMYAGGYTKGEGLAKIYETKRDLLNAHYDKTKGDNTENQQKVLQIVSKEKIEEMLKKMEINLKDRSTHLAYTMIQIYKHYQFRNDVSGMEIYFNKSFNELEPTERKERNYLVLGKPPESMSFVLNNYKTSKKYGEKFIEIEQTHLKRIIRNWINFKIDGRWEDIQNKVVYLFDWATGTPLTRNDVSHTLSSTFEKYLGVSVSTTLLRKIYGVNIADPNNATDDEIEKVAAQAFNSGHSVLTKASVYSN